MSWVPLVELGQQLTQVGRAVVLRAVLALLRILVVMAEPVVRRIMMVVAVVVGLPDHLDPGKMVVLVKPGRQEVGVEVEVQMVGRARLALLEPPQQEVRGVMEQVVLVVVLAVVQMERADPVAAAVRVVMRRLPEETAVRGVCKLSGRKRATVLQQDLEGVAEGEEDRTHLELQMRGVVVLAVAMEAEEAEVRTVTERQPV